MQKNLFPRIDHPNLFSSALCSRIMHERPEKEKLLWAGQLIMYLLSVCWVLDRMGYLAEDSGTQDLWI